MRAPAMRAGCSGERHRIAWALRATSRCLERGGTRLAHRLDRVLRGQELGRLDSPDMAGPERGEEDRGHRGLVGRLKDGDSVILAEAVVADLAN
jgi:hypothetical protein